MMALIAVLSLLVAMAAGSWVILDKASRAWRAYQEHLGQETRQTLEAAFVFIDPRALRPVWLALIVVASGLAAWLSGQGWVVLPLLIFALFLPQVILRRLRRQRAHQFDAQMPGLVQALAEALRAGAGMQPALQQLVARSDPPLSQEWGLMLDEQRLGLSFEDALAGLRTRMPTAACSLTVSALNVAAHTGGGLADTLDGIAETLRARQHWLGRVRALTAQGRMQSVIMAGLPVLLLIVLHRLEPAAMALLWTTLPGGAVLCLIVLLEVGGLLWIRRLVAIDV